MNEGMNEYGAFMERYWQEALELLEKSLFPCMDGTEIEDGCPQ